MSGSLTTGFTDTSSSGAGTGVTCTGTGVLKVTVSLITSFFLQYLLQRKIIHRGSTVTKKLISRTIANTSCHLDLVTE